MDVEDNVLKINLPKDFPSGKAEVIVLAVEELKRKRKKFVLPELVEISKKNYASQIILEERR